MQGGKGAVGSVLEAAANIAASAKSGLDKTKAVVEEKVERMSTKDEVEKDIATLRKEEKLDLAKRRKCKAYAQNAAAAAAPPGAVSPNFTDGGGFDTCSRPAAILSSNADLGSTPVSGASHVVHEQVAVGSNPNHTRMPAQVVQAVDSDPNHAGMPAQPLQAVDSNPTPTEMPGQVVQPVGGGMGSQDSSVASLNY
ncbi:Late embryogenesis abundant group 4 [Heracleum sosnowskyi]|uniref:Late embryogenesis abundant group 4 n=1 Tax=Heracleum sosnowskyi TaxID=360622 RepID=A0AAD8HHJ4_9APIA|nr:Late embryogenesis abundant group 4 [Heracleum sosnowskyi]